MNIDTKPYLIKHWKDKGHTNAEGWVVIDQLINGVSGGGTFMHPNASMEEVADLARSMSFKNSLQEIPFGGGKAGIKYDPKNKNAKQVLARFLLSNKEIIESIWCTGADLNTNNKDITEVVRNNLHLSSPFISLAHLIETREKINFDQSVFEKFLFANVNEYFTAEEAVTGYTLAEIVRYLSRGMLHKPRIAIQGFGKVGSSLAYFLSKNSIADIVGICEYDHFIVNPDGLDIAAMFASKATDQSTYTILDNYEDAQSTKCKFQHKNSKDILSEFLKHIEADIFMPCATRYIIDENILDILDQLTFGQSTNSARYILCGCNNTFKNSKVLNECLNMDINFLPEWLTNCGSALFFQLCLRQKEYSYEKLQSIFDRIVRRVIYFIELSINNHKKPKVFYEFIEKTVRCHSLNNFKEKNNEKYVA